MKNWIVLLLFACLAACTDRTGYVVKGVFEGAGDGCAVLKFGDDSPGIDTVRMKGEGSNSKGMLPMFAWRW